MDGGPGQFKTIASYIPIGEGKYVAVAFEGINFDWTLDGMKPTVTHCSTSSGFVQINEERIEFILITYALDDQSRPVYIQKAVGAKQIIDRDTLSVENLVLHFYTHPETANPVTDRANFCVPDGGSFPSIREYRIRLQK